MELRDYQLEAIGSVKKNYAQGLTRLLVSLPTGCGKTVVFSSLAKDMNCRTLILAHRDELLKQAKEKLEMVWPDAEIGIVKAEQDEYEKQVVIASVQTLSVPKRLQRLVDSGSFQLTIVDEAHHATSPSYKRIFETLGFMNDDPTRLLVGVTATPKRSDKVGLHGVFQEIVYHTSILTMIRAGYLTDLRAIKVETGVSLSGIQVSRGDFNESQLAAVVNTRQRNQMIVDSYLEHAAGHKGIAFCVDVAHSRDLAQAFVDNGIPAEHVSGDTPSSERTDILKRLKSGETQIVTNCAVLTEGFDEPTIQCVLMTRPTKSTTLYAQCIGRGTRRALGKTECIILDFTDSRHDVCQLPSLLGVSENKLRQRTVREALEQPDNVESMSIEPTTGKLKTKSVEFDLLGQSMFNWIETNNGWRLPISPGIYVILKPDKDDLFKVNLVTHGSERLLHAKSLDLGYAQGVAEDHARKYGGQFARKDADWRSDPVTEKQIRILKHYGHSDFNITKGEASNLLEQYFATNKKSSYRRRA